MNAEAGRLISRLGLSPLPLEGGFYARAWTSPGRGADGRALASAILFLMTPGQFSALHRLGMDEVWEHSAGDPAELFRIDPRAGTCRRFVLGARADGGRAARAVVPAGVWQGARVLPRRGARARGWALLSCVVSPAWDEGAFELGGRDALVREFPAHARVIRALTR
jgi:hypothetical protein